MKHIVAAFIAGTVILSNPAWAAGPTHYRIDEANSRLEFSFRSSLHAVKGRARHFRGGFIGASDDPQRIMEGQVEVPTVSLDTEHPRRDEAMFRMFEHLKFPEIRFKTQEIIPQAAEGALLMRGILTIRDVSRPVEILARLGNDEGNLRLSGQCALSLKNFKLKPPSVLGVIRVFDTVTVQFDVTLTEESHVAL